MSSEIRELFSVVQSDLDFQLRRELFSVVQSHPKKKGHRLTVSSGLCKRTPTSLRTNPTSDKLRRTPTSLRTIQISNHLTSVVIINRPSCDQLMQPPEKLGTCTSPPLAIYLNSKNKNYTKRTMSIKISSIPHPPKEK